MSQLHVRAFIHLIVFSIYFDYNINSTTIRPIHTSSGHIDRCYTNSAETIDAEKDLSDTLHELELVFAGQSEHSMSDESPIGITFINWLERQYIKMERLLWSEIDYHSKDNNSDVDLLEMIRICHAIFLNGNFRENSIDLNLFDAYDEILFDSIVSVNRSVRIARDTYLNNQETLKNELNTILIVQDQFELKKWLDNIYEYITSTDRFLRSVSRSICVCSFFVIFFVLSR